MTATYTANDQRFLASDSCATHRALCGILIGAWVKPSMPLTCFVCVTTRIDPKRLR